MTRAVMQSLFLSAVAGLAVIAAWRVAFLYLAKHAVWDWEGGSAYDEWEDAAPAWVRCDCENCTYHDEMLNQPIGYTLGLDQDNLPGMGDR